MDREPDSLLPLAEQFRFDAGSPGLDLLATVGFRASSPVERLTSTRRLREWFALVGLPPVAVHDADLATIRTFREDGYAVLAAVAHGTRPPNRSVAVLGRWAERPRPGDGLRVRDGVLEVRPVTPTFDAVLTDLARDLAGVALGHHDRLRVCAAGTCGLVYLDTSRGRRRQWCSMARCGNRAKAARHRERSAS